MRATLGDLATRFGCELAGDPAVTVTHVATLANANGESLSFFSNPAYRQDLKGTRAGAVVLREEDAGDCPVNALISTEPYVTFARIATLLHPPEALPPGIHPTAVVDPSARIAPTAHVGPHAVIGQEAVVGDQAAVGPNAVVGPRCTVGAHTRLHANVTLVQDVVIGERCIVHPGAVIGSDGFGNAMSDSGWVKVPQVGGVKIGDDVEIGANTAVDRGTLDDTVVGARTKIDNLCQVGHNVRIGTDCLIAGMTGIAGSARIGDGVIIGGAVAVSDHVTINSGARIAGRSGVTKDVPPGETWAGFPAKPHRQFARSLYLIERLEDMWRAFKAMERG